MAKVLLVDDEPDFIDFLVQCLEGSDITIFTARDGIEALELVKKVNPNLVVTDIMMPEMDGVKLVQAITDIDPSTMIITVTGYPDWEDKIETIKESVQISLLKPVQIDDVVSSIDICLSLNKTASPKVKLAKKL